MGHVDKMARKSNNTMNNEARIFKKMMAGC